MNTQLNMKKSLDKFIPITKVVDYYPPKFVDNWDGSFNKIKIGKNVKIEFDVLLDTSEEYQPISV